MVLTRSQYENMSKEELIEQLVSHDDIAAKLSELTKRFNEFSKYEALHSELKIIQNCSTFSNSRQCFGGDSMSGFVPNRNKCVP